MQPAQETETRLQKMQNFIFTFLELYSIFHETLAWKRFFCF